MWDPKFVKYIFFGHITWLLMTAILAHDSQFVEWNMQQ